MTDQNNDHLIDPALLAGEDDTGIPTFLRRDPMPATPTPVFATAENAEGQTELTVEEQAYADEDPHADQPSDDIAMATLDQLPAQSPLLEAAAEAEALNAPIEVDRVTSQGNEALISNAPSQIEAQSQAGAPTNHNAPGDPEKMRRDFFKDVNAFGKASGEGSSALGRLGLRALRAAADGIISTAKPQGGGKDDATLIYETYQAMDSKHADHTAGGAKANASKLRQIIGMGCMTTISDPVAIGNRVLRIHEKMTDAELKPKAIFAALVDVAREQQASDTELTDAAIEDCLTKSKPDKTLEKEWQAIAKKVHDITSGEATHGLKDDSPAALKILELVEEQVKNFVAGGVRQDRIKAVLEMGYSQEQAVSIVDKQLGI